MRTVDQVIVAMAERRGIKLASDEIKVIRRQVESAYLDSIMDGVAPFCTTKQGDSNGRADGKEKRDLSR